MNGYNLKSECRCILLVWSVIPFNNATELGDNLVSVSFVLSCFVCSIFVYEINRLIMSTLDSLLSLRTTLFTTRRRTVVVLPATIICRLGKQTEISAISDNWLQLIDRIVYCWE